MPNARQSNPPPPLASADHSPSTVAVTLGLIELADMRSLALVLLHYALAAFAFTHFRGWPAAVVALVVACSSLLSFLTSVVVHNTVHCPIFHRRAFNKAFQVVLSLGQGHPVTAFVPGHNLSHHMHTSTAKDIMRPTQARFGWNLLNQLLFFFLVIPEIMDSERRWGLRMRRENPAFFRQWIVESVVVYGVKVGLLLVDWQAALLFVWLPHLYGNWGIVGTNVWQHDGTDPSHAVNHSRSVTGRFFNWLAFNNGLHAAHHCNPGLHWSRLRAYHERHVAPRAHPSLLQPTLTGYLWRAYVQPGVRVGLDGAPRGPVAREPSVDWMAEVDLADPRYRKALGAD